jgi:two-component sensor histidine kinase
MDIVQGLVTISFVKDSEIAPAYFIGQVLDITERKLAEEKIQVSLQEKETLLQELYHRTKNNMQVIASYLQLQAANTKDEKFDRIVADLVSRIQAMSLVHQKLYRSKNLSRIDMKDYITDLVINILSYFKVSRDQVAIRFDLEPIEALIDIAIPCGLVINELVSNALKYAFPGRRKGELLIELHRNVSGEIVLKIGDNGIGIDAGVDMRSLKSLGLQTVFNIVERQLGGSVFCSLPDGLKWTITFKDSLYWERV